MQEPEALNNDNDNEDARPVLRVNGEDVSLPDVLSLNLDEGIVLYDYSGMGVDQVETMNGLNPHVVKALIHIAIQRKQPDLSYSECREVAGSVTFQQLAKALGIEGDVRPPARANSDAGESSGSTENGSGSAGVTKDSASPDGADQQTSGTSDSDTATSPSIRSAA